MLSALRILPLLFCLGRCLANPTYAHARGGCPRCDDGLCPKSEEECPHGLVADVCGCCPQGVCSLGERERCFAPDFGPGIAESGMQKYGTCGEHMDCVPRTDLGPNDQPESLCLCKEEKTVCGSDNITYGSACEVRNSKIHVIHMGPCITRPAIVAGPRAAFAHEGSSLGLDCEAKGFPVPSIVWEFHSASGLRKTMPGDDPTVVVHSRGGPENYMLTSWLQIEALRRSDSGTYICIARNSEGEDRAPTSVQTSLYSL